MAITAPLPLREDVDIIDCVERIWAWAEANHAEEIAAATARATQFESLTDNDCAAALIALHLQMDEERNSDRRRLRLMLDKCLAEETQEPGKAEFIAECTVGDARPISPAQAARIVQGIDFLSRGEFRTQLGRQRNPCAAAGFVARRMPSLTGLNAYRFLVRIGYPAAVPSGTVRRCLVRLGLSGTGGAGTDRRVMEQLMRLARLSGRPLVAIDAMLGCFISGVCTLNAACERCPVSRYCVASGQIALAKSANRTPIRDWQESERPRERLLNGKQLSDTELLAIILRTGSARGSAVDLARRLLDHFGSLQRLAVASPTAIAKIPDIGNAKAAQIKAAIELGRRATDAGADERMRLPSVAQSADVFQAFRSRFVGATQEQFYVLVLNNKNRIAREFRVSLGTLNTGIVHPRDVFRDAIAESAAAVIFLHNHPSGDPKPSSEDRALTRRLVEAGKMLGIPVLDHVIIGAQRHYSFADEGEIG